MQGTPLDAHTRGPQDLPHPPIYYVLEITDSQPAVFGARTPRSICQRVACARVGRGHTFAILLSLHPDLVLPLSKSQPQVDHPMDQGAVAD
jgi:hypothetical protein